MAKRWSSGTTLPSGPMVVRITKLDPVPIEPTLVTSGGPKRLRERKLALAVDFLAAKHQDGMVLECRAHRGIDGIVIRDIRKRYAAQFGAKSRTDRDDIHRRFLRFLFARISSKTGRLARKLASEAGKEPSRKLYAVQRQP